VSIYTFITAPFRYQSASSDDIRNAFSLARSIEIDSRLTNLYDASAIASTIFDILAAPRVRFEVPVLGVNIINASMYNGQTPCATLMQNRFNMQTGRLVIIPEFRIDLNTGQTILRCWG
jgi:hypothetical protein